jgi:hypothetical protein
MDYSEGIEKWVMPTFDSFCKKIAVKHRLEPFVNVGSYLFIYARPPFIITEQNLTT